MVGRRDECRLKVNMVGRWDECRLKVTMVGRRDECRLKVNMVGRRGVDGNNEPLGFIDNHLIFSKFFPYFTTSLLIVMW